MTSALQAQTSSFESVISPLPEDELEGDIYRQQEIVKAMTDIMLDDVLSIDHKEVEATFILEISGCTNLEGRILHLFAIRAAQKARGGHVRSI